MLSNSEAKLENGVACKNKMCNHDILPYTVGSIGYTIVKGYPCAFNL